MADSWLPARKRRIFVALATAAVAVGALFWTLNGGGDDDDEAGRPAGLSASAAALARDLSVTDQADQVLLADFQGSHAIAAPGQLGGILVEANSWADRAQGHALVAALSRPPRADGIPPLLVAAQEGGPNRALTDLPPQTRQLEIGDRGSATEAATWAQDAASSLADAGFDLNLFPVADVATLDSPIADRAFSDDAAVVASLTAAALRGCDRASLTCAPLHFPGVGAASQDTADGPASVGLDAGALAARDLQPFRAAIAANAPAIVISVALYPAFNPVTPAALAPEIATRLLRDQLGFEGVAISDDLSSGAIAANMPVPEAAVAALAAGCDLVQIGAADPVAVRAAIVAAIDGGRLSGRRLAEAAGRVAGLKQDLGLIAN